MRLFTILVAIAFASSPVYAQGRGVGQAKKPATASAKATPRPSGAKTTRAAQPAKTAAKAERRVVKVETRAAKTAAKAETRAVKTETKAARKSGAVTTTTVVTPTTPTTRAVKNPKLEARLVALLPAGTNIQDASQGFKNWGQFVAAVHVSKNLNIPFADLKTAMTGLTPGTTAPATTGMSLGQAIQSLQGTTTTQPATLSSNQIKTEVMKAEDAANIDLRRSRDGS
jgi:hypothetical protein